MKSIMFPPNFGKKAEQNKRIKPILSFNADVEADDLMGAPVFEKVTKPKIITTDAQTKAQKKKAALLKQADLFEERGNLEKATELRKKAEEVKSDDSSTE